jgi:hypothetical protein
MARKLPASATAASDGLITGRVAIGTTYSLARIGAALRINQDH